MSWFLPSRAGRRAQSGRPCPSCGLRLHPLDVVGWADGPRTVYLHRACAQLLVEQADQALPEAHQDGEPALD